MLAEIEAGFLVSGTHPQPHGAVGDPQDDPGHDERVGDPDDGQHRLAAELGPAPGLACGVHGEAGEHAGEQDPDRPAHHVDADHVEGVVVVEYVLQVNRAVAEQAGRGAGVSGNLVKMSEMKN